MTAELALIMALATEPPPQPLKLCRMAEARTCIALFVDYYSHEEACTLQAKAYIVGSMDMGDEVLFSMPIKTPWGVYFETIASYVAQDSSRWSWPAWRCIYDPVKARWPRRAQQ